MAPIVVLGKSIRVSKYFLSIQSSGCILSYAPNSGHLFKLNVSSSKTLRESTASMYKRHLHMDRHCNLLTGAKSAEHFILLPSCAIQTRSFSLRDSMDSALTTHSSIFKSISESEIVQFFQNTIIQFHEYTGLPWWLSIVSATFITRGVLTLPVALYQQRVIATLENARIEMNDIVNDIKYDLNRDVRKHKLSEKMAQRRFRSEVRKEWNKLVLKHNCHPAKVAILAIVQIPLWVMLSTAFRNMIYMMPVQDFQAQLVRLELSTGGLLWCPNLCLPDSFALPIALGVTNLIIIEMQKMTYKGERTRLQRYVTNFFRGFAIFMIPVAASIPSCLTLYWFSSSLFGLMQNLVVLSPRLRRVVGIPTSPSTLPNPYAHIAQQVRQRLGR